ncbi:MAG: hypothetical protein K2H82_11100 [Oscillospiraceae bacterium]|nr:hypothetical protein [Oscillospiraceae bacterium]
MKRMIAMTAIIATTAVLLMGCGQVGEKSETINPETEVQTSDFSFRNVSEIHIHETGGEDGRDQNWIISKMDGRNTVVFTDNNMRKTLTYLVSDEDFQNLTCTDFSDYVGIKADMENIDDAVYYTIEIIYDDGTKDEAEIYIPALWNKLYEMIGTYEPEVELSEPRDTDPNLDSDPETPFPEIGTIGEYVYRIEQDVFEIGRERGYYFDEENRPDSPLFVYICSGAKTIGADIYISDLSVDGDKLVITVTETFPDDSSYDAYDWPQCMIEISPKPENVEVKSTNGVNFQYIDMLLYDKEVSEEDILSDEEHGIKYAKNQLLISAFPETEKKEIEKIAEEMDAEVVGYIELTGDYQIEFRNDKSPEELETIADYLNSYPFVMNVTLNMISDVTADDR